MDLSIGYRRGQVKPPGIPRLNRRHPLAQGLVFYGFDAGNGPIDLVAGRPAGYVGTMPSSATSRWGQGLLWNNSGAAWFAPDAAIENATDAGGYTFACAYVQTGTVGTSARPFGRTAGNGASSPYENWVFQVNRAGAGQNQVVPYLNSGGTQSGLAIWKGNANEIFTTVAVVAFSTAVAGFYAQGTTLGNTSALTLQSANANSAIVFAGGSAAGSLDPFVGFVFYGAFWARPLAAGEILALHQSPYDLLEWPSDRLLLPGSIAAHNLTSDRPAAIETAARLPTPPVPVPVEFGGRISTDRWAAIEAAATLPARPAPVPVEFGGGIRTDRWAAIEAAATLPARPALVPVEFGGGISTDRWAAIEAAATLPARPAPVPVEFGGGFSTDRWAAIEAAATLPAPPAPIEFGNFASTDRWIGAEAVARALRDVLPPIEAMRTQIADRRSPAESGESVAADRPIGAEAIARASRDGVSSIEAVGTQITDCRLPAESGESVAADRPIGAEAIARASRDGVSPIEATGTQIADRRSPAESGESVAADRPIGAEAVAHASRDGRSPIEAAGAQIANGRSPAESGESVATDRRIGAEAAARTSRDGVPPIEAMGTQTADGRLPAESGKSVATDRWPAIEASEGVVSNRHTGAESTESLSLDRAVPAEGGEEVLRDTRPPIESLASQAADGRLPGEGFGSQVADGAASAESRKRLAADRRVPSEASGAVAVDRFIDPESNETFSGDRSISTEWGNAVSRDMLPTAESLTSQATDQSAPLELLMTLARGPAAAEAGGADLEVVASFRAISWLADEMQSQTFSVSGQLLPTENATAMVGSGDARTEAVVGLLRDTTPAIEALLTARRDGAPVEFGLWLRVDPPTADESGALAITDRLLPAEGTANLASDQRAPSELSAAASADNPTPIEQSAAGASIFVPLEYAASFTGGRSLPAIEALAASQNAGAATVEVLQALLTLAGISAPLEFQWTKPNIVTFVAAGRLRRATPSLARPQAFAPLAPGEIDNFAFDFTAAAGGAAITTLTIACALRPFQTIMDPTPQSQVLSVAAQTSIATDPPANFPAGLLPVNVIMKGAFAVALVGGFSAAKAGAFYTLTATVTTSDGRTLTLSADLPIEG